MDVVEFVKTLKNMCEQMGTEYDPCERCKLYSGGSNDCGLWSLIENIKIENIERAVPVVNEWKRKRDYEEASKEPDEANEKREKENLNVFIVFVQKS